MAATATRLTKAASAGSRWWASFLHPLDVEFRILSLSNNPIEATAPTGKPSPDDPQAGTGDTAQFTRDDAERFANTLADLIVKIAKTNSDERAVIRADILREAAVVAGLNPDAVLAALPLYASMIVNHAGGIRLRTTLARYYIAVPISPAGQ